MLAGKDDLLQEFFITNVSLVAMYMSNHSSKLAHVMLTSSNEKKDHLENGNNQRLPKFRL
jgi:hypothetical protein